MGRQFLLSGYQWTTRAPAMMQLQQRLPWPWYHSCEVAVSVHQAHCLQQRQHLMLRQRRKSPGSSTSAWAAT